MPPAALFSVLLTTVVLVTSSTFVMLIVTFPVVSVPGTASPYTVKAGSELGSIIVCAGVGIAIFFLLLYTVFSRNGAKSMCVYLDFYTG